MYPGVEQLRDIHGIQGVPWWPPGPGWWILAAAVLALIFLAWRFRTNIRLRVPPIPMFTVGRWRWDAARRLRDLRKRVLTQDSKQTASELSELIRRIAMARLGREACAESRCSARENPIGIETRSPEKQVIACGVAAPEKTR